MNYEQKYNQALENFKKIKNANSNNKKLVNFIECEYPELRESEDERIRKGLIKGLSAMRDIHKHQTFSDDAINIDDAIAWLEKQGEQKLVEQDTEVNALWVYIREWNDKFGRLPKDEDELVACIYYVMQRQKPSEWSEEDENMRSAILQDLVNIKTTYPKINLQEEIDWLKSIKPNHWKPSEQNIKDLEWCADLVKDKMGVGFHRLQVFIDEIKKL